MDETERDPWLGRELSGLVLERLLGHGPVGRVYAARDRGSGAERAVKVLHGRLARHEAARRRFVEQARAAARLQDGRALVPLAVAQAPDGTPYVVTARATGRSLAELLGAGARPLEWTLALAAQLAELLAAAHRAQLLHRDLHPGNVFVGGSEQQPEIEVTDFGLARVLDAAGDGTAALLPARIRCYLAPEQLRGAPLDARADLYALGAILAHCLSGRPPQPHSPLPAAASVPGGGRPAADSQPLTLPPLPAEAPLALGGLLERLLDGSPAGRPESAALVHATLGRLAAVRPQRGLGQLRTAGQTQALRLQAPAGTASERVFLVGGAFRRGRQDRHKDQRPVREVRVSSFYLARYPVTHLEYARFLAALRTSGEPHLYCHPDEPPDKDHTPGVDELWAREFVWKRGRPPRGLEQCPVVLVDWFDAFAYAAWAGGRLPTEAEWEYAAGGRRGWPYPWGHTPPTAAHASFAERDRVPSPVGMRKEGASPEGIEELLGNVWEWCQDLYSPRYYAEGETEDPCNESHGVQRVCRGGSFRTPHEALHRAERGARDPLARALDVGFRVAFDAEDR
ncbi:MAG: hypothetical protein KatS3mg102_1444 [Planctomycetota bacterium]|nr:MAG: hypothetical protein KatS3mg102_1444 [Planctomycetota bacterium]